MRKRLQTFLMAGTLAATSLITTPLLCAADGDGNPTKIIVSDDHGRKIYVNDFAPVTPARPAEASAPRRALMYWSSKDNRWKPVPPPNARSEERRVGKECRS